jgi:hypothetical protein
MKSDERLSYACLSAFGRKTHSNHDLGTTVGGHEVRFA